MKSSVFFQEFIFETVDPHPDYIPTERKQELKKLQSQLQIWFENLSYLHIAFTHKSYSNENPLAKNYNERLEFLGDSVLSLITVEYLYLQNPSWDEGRLSAMKAVLVSEKTLATIARKLRLADYLLLGKGERNSGGLDRDSNLANLLEALLGAIFLDQGLMSAKNWFVPFLEKNIIQLNIKKQFRDYKSILQEYTQKKFKLIPNYRLLKESGPDHEKIFVVEVSILHYKASGEGKTKRQAEADAARKLYDQFNHNKKNG